jgi:hypothetical protein
MKVDQESRKGIKRDNRKHANVTIPGIDLDARTVKAPFDFRSYQLLSLSFPGFLHSLLISFFSVLSVSPW